MAESTLHMTSKVTPLQYTNRYIAFPPEPRDARFDGLYVSARHLLPSLAFG